MTTTTPFLQNLAHKLIRDYPDNLHEVCVVLPNRRARVFLKDALQDAISKPVWMPEIFGMEDFIERVSGKKIISSFSLLLELYQVRKQIEKSPRTIDEFIQWGTVMLGDFNELDLYAVNADLLFENLTDVKAIEKWHPGKGLSDMEKNYLRFFASLKSYYYALNERLNEKGEAYQGAAFRYVADNMESLYESMPWTRVVFAGFNAISETENRIITFLEDKDLAISLFDADHYYLDDERQEAGMFLRKLQKKYKKETVSWVGEAFREPKNVNIVRAAGKLTMAKAVSSILESLPDSDNPADTVLVLADEELLIPAISAIPDSIGKYNVTMGYAFSDTAAAELILNMLELYSNAAHNRQEHNRNTYFYRYLVNFFQHPYIAYLDDFSAVDLRKLIERIVKRNKVMYSYDDLVELAEGLTLSMEILPGEPAVTPSEALERIQALFAKLHDAMYRDGLNTGNQKFEYEFVCQAITFLNKLTDLTNEYEDIENIRILTVVTKQMIREVAVPFIGEPLSGLQVMGMLETRTLNFKNVIMLSVNEGVLPKAKSYHSLIPHDLRKSFGIPSYTEKNAVFAYHFYRLLQHAENIWCLYDTQSEVMGKGEPSRFLLQLQEELPVYNPEIIIKRYDVQDKEIPKTGEGLVEVTKSEDVIDALKVAVDKGLSPSALNTYKSCPVKFFLNHVMSVKEADEVEESVDARIFGNVVHKALENLYNPYLKKVLTVDDCRVMVDKAESVLRKAFETEYEGNSFGEGRNLLAFNAALTYINRMLRYELSRVQNGDEVMITFLEEDLRTQLEIPRDGKETIQANFRGFVDRIEEWNKNVTVIDYKTGKVEDEKSTFTPEKVLVDKTGKYKIEFQLFMYSWLYRCVKTTTQVPQSGAWALRYSSNPIKLVSAGSYEHSVSFMDEFERHLKDLVTEMFDEDTPFRRTEELKLCEYCPYASSICLR